MNQTFKHSFWVVESFKPNWLSNLFLEINNSVVRRRGENSQNEKRKEGRRKKRKEKKTNCVKMKRQKFFKSILFS